MFEMVGVPVDPPALTEEELLAAMADAQRAVNRLQAAQLACAAEFGTRRPAPDEPVLPGGERARWAGVSEFADAEIAAALTISPRAADRLLGTAVDLHRLPATAAVFAAGDLDLPRVRLICESTAHLDDADAAAVEARVLHRAPGQVYSALRRALRRASVQTAPAADQHRQAHISDQRCTWTEHDGDGRSRFTAEGPTHDVLRLAAAVDAVARTLPPDTGDPGGATLTQRRFDALTAIADTILDDPALPHTRFGPPGVVLLPDVATLARLHAEHWTGPGDSASAHPVQPAGSGTGWPVQPAPGGAGRPVELAGDGPIPDSLAVELLNTAHTVVVPFDPATGWACEHSLGCHVPDRLARYLTGRHPRCVFPGCAVPAHRCDWDHVMPAPDGPTCACNLVPLCRYHHRLKTHTRWRLTLHPDGRVHWTSPTGRSYQVHPDTDVGAVTAA